MTDSLPSVPSQYDAAGMEIEYELTRDDLFAYQWRAAYLSANSRRLRHRSYLYLLLPFIVLAALSMMGSGSAAGAAVAFSSLAASYAIVAVLYSFVYPWALGRAILSQLAQERPDKGQLGTHKIVLDDDGLVETTVVGETRTTWRGVHRVEQDSSYIYIYSAPAAAHIVPKRAFTASSAEDFYRFATERTSRAEAGPGTAASA